MFRDIPISHPAYSSAKLIGFARENSPQARPIILLKLNDAVLQDLLKKVANDE